MTAINLEERKRFIGASESAALLGISNYSRLYKGKAELFKQKTNQVEPESIGSQNAPSIFWGHQLEEAVLTAVPKLYPQYPWVAGKLECHWLDPVVEGMACSPDSMVRTQLIQGDIFSGELGVLEAKTTKNPRIMPVDGTCPPAWQVQVQHQIACSDAYYPDDEEGPITYGLLACLIQGHDFRLWKLERDEVMIARIRAEIKLFWEEVEEWRADHPEKRTDMYEAYVEAETAPDSRTPECTTHTPETVSPASNQKDRRND